MDEDCFLPRQKELSARTGHGPSSAARAHTKSKAHSYSPRAGICLSSLGLKICANEILASTSIWGLPAAMVMPRFTTERQQRKQYSCSTQWDDAILRGK